MKILNRFIIVIVLLAVLGGAAFSHAVEAPVWWPDAEKEAGEYGYRLMTPEGLDQMIASGESILILDVRPRYEYETGHLPEAVCMEFDLGDRQRLKEEKKQRLMELIGPEKDRTVVIYCRSFR
jgi:3-mercaptopyruvate sulfurtransferase SseA